MLLQPLSRQLATVDPQSPAKETSDAATVVRFMQGLAAEADREPH